MSTMNKELILSGLQIPALIPTKYVVLVPGTFHMRSGRWLIPT